MNNAACRDDSGGKAVYDVTLIKAQKGANHENDLNYENDNSVAVVLMLFSFLFNITDLLSYLLERVLEIRIRILQLCVD